MDGQKWRLQHYLRNYVVASFTLIQPHNFPILICIFYIYLHMQITTYIFAYVDYFIPICI